MEHFWYVASFAAVIFSSIVTTALVITYGVSTQWDRTQVGRQFMLTKASLALVLDWWALSLLFITRPHEYTGTMPARTIICLVVGIVMLRWLVILIRTQRQARRKYEDLRS